jgi:hypothetical protein
MRKINILQKIKLIRFADKIASNNLVFSKLFNFIADTQSANKEV